MSDLQFGLFDILPTLCDIGGCTHLLPTDLDGISIYNELKGEEQKDHEYIMFTWHGLGNTEPINFSGKKSISGYSIRVGNYKGIVALWNGRKYQPSLHDDMQLFDLQTIPSKIMISAKHIKMSCCD